MMQTKWTTALSIALVAMGVSVLQGNETMKLIPSHPLAKVMADAALTASAPASLSWDGAAGETVSGQVVVLVGESSDVVTASISDLQHEEGVSQIPALAAKLQWVRYLDITKNSPGVPEDELVASAPASIPDAFWEDAERAVEVKAAQPLWIELTIPIDALPGVYRGTLSVTGQGGRVELPLSTRVRSFKLSQERHRNVIQHRFSQRGKRQMNITPFRPSSQIAGGGVPLRGSENTACC